MGNVNSNPAISRQALCFCPTTNAEDISEDNICQLCQKIVLVIDLEKCKEGLCNCVNPVENEYYFCDICRKAIPGEDGNQRIETSVQIQRYLRINREKFVKKHFELILDYIRNHYNPPVEGRTISNEEKSAIFAEAGEMFESGKSQKDVMDRMLQTIYQKMYSE